MDFYIIYSVLLIHLFTCGQTARTKREWSRFDFPNPQREPEECGRDSFSDSFICDPDRILLTEDDEGINRMLLEIRDRYSQCVCTSTPCGVGSGYRFAIAMVGKISSDKDEKTRTQEFADYLRKSSWNFGRCGEDLVIVLSVGDRSIYTSIGRKTREILKENCVDDINKQHSYNLTNGYLTNSIKSILTQYRYVLEKKRECYTPFPWIPVIFGTIGSVSFVGLIIYLIKKEMFDEACDLIGCAFECCEDSNG